MSHLRPTEVIQLAAGELDPEHRAEAARHLESCPTCRAAYERHIALWATLGDWQAAGTGRDLWLRLEGRLAASRPTILRPWWPAAARVAAAVLLGIGTGYAGARLSLGPRAALPGTTVAAAAADDAWERRVPELADPSPAGLYATWLELAAGDEPQEGQS